MRLLLLFIIVFTACSKKSSPVFISEEAPIYVDFTIAFGSCNDQDRKNDMWPAIINTDPDVWIWGGDNVYSDTDDMKKLRRDYSAVYNHPGYSKLRGMTTVLGTWDDHDYGLNDGGEEFAAKAESKMELLRFLETPEDDIRYRRDGVYYNKLFTIDGRTINIIVLDTRTFRTALTKSEATHKRYKPNPYGEGTILGSEQWDWLGDQLDLGSDLNIIVSSIQVLSQEHGFETWGNFPHERDRLMQMINEHDESRTLCLSGDRHIAEFSKMEVAGYPYPIYDFTSSGMTHAYTRFSQEENKWREGEVFSDKNFGVVLLDMDHLSAVLQIRNEQGEVVREKKVDY